MCFFKAFKSVLFRECVFKGVVTRLVGMEWSGCNTEGSRWSLVPQRGGGVRRRMSEEE